MLMPKRVKRRKQFRGSMRGKALRGNTMVKYFPQKELRKGAINNVNAKKSKTS